LTAALSKRILNLIAGTITRRVYTSRPITTIWAPRSEVWQLDQSHANIRRQNERQSPVLGRAVIAITHLNTVPAVKSPDWHVL